MAEMQAPIPQSVNTKPPTEGYCIEVCVMPDGSITVESGPLDEAGEPTGTPVESIEQALEKVRELYAAGGQGGDEAFTDGFGKAETPPMMVRMREGE